MASPLRVLLVEDEALVAMTIEDMLGELGATVVATAGRLEDALDKAGSLAFDVAILDINLHGRPSVPVAELLRQRGLPFIVATGYGDAMLPEPLRAVPVLAKPFQRGDLARVLAAAKPP